MSIDVSTEIDIACSRDHVAAYACDPANVRTRYRNIRAVDWKTSPPLGIGTRLGFVASFLGRRLEYTYEVIAFEPGMRLVMRADQGPFPMETTYLWIDLPDGRTRMTLRNRGEPGGLAKITVPLVARAVRLANRKDLARLKAILEHDAA